jgi:hypothetical protein
VFRDALQGTLLVHGAEGHNKTGTRTYPPSLAYCCGGMIRNERVCGVTWYGKRKGRDFGGDLDCIN